VPLGRGSGVVLGRGASGGDRGLALVRAMEATMAGMAGKLSEANYMKGANRRDRRSQVRMCAKIARRALNRAVRREGKKVSRDHTVS